MAALLLAHISASVLAGLLIGGALVYKTISIYIQYRRLQHIKGPFIAAVSSLWLFYHTLRGDNYLAVAAALRKYGSPVRIGPCQVATDDPIIQRHIVSSKSLFIKGHWFKGMKFDPRVDNLLSLADEKAHSELRNKLIPGYTGQEVPTLESDIDVRVVQLLDLIRQEYIAKRQHFDFALLVSYFTIDVLTQIAFGGALGFLTKNEDVFNYIKSSTNFFPVMELSSNHPTIYRILNSRFISSAAPKPTDKIGFGAILGHTQRVIAERFRPHSKQSDDMIGSFIRHGLNQQQCESESLLQLLAGADSTATALRTTVLYILTNPCVYSKLNREIQVAREAGNISHPVIKNSEAQGLSYLSAVIREGLRMLMPLHGLGGRVSPEPNGITLNGVFLPAGTDVGFAAYAMLRREDIFGHDADSFRPERWIDEDKQTVANMEKVHSLIFGSGRSSCLGKNIALMELRKAIFELFSAFDMSIVNPFNPIYMRSNSVVIQKNLLVRAYVKGT